MQQGAQTTQPNAAQPDAEQAQQEDKSGEGDKDKGSILDLYNEDKKEEENTEMMSWRIQGASVNRASLSYSLISENQNAVFLHTAGVSSIRRGRS